MNKQIKIFSLLMICLTCAAICAEEAKAESDSKLEGKALVAFLKKYVEVEISVINKGHSISLRVPNAEGSDRSFYSILLFLVSYVETKESDVDVLEVKSGKNGGDIDFLMNISDTKLRSSYIVLREEIRDNARKKSELADITIRLEDLLLANLPKIEKPDSEAPAIRAE